MTAVWENIPIEKETLEVIWLDSDGAELDRKTYHTGEVEPVTKHKPSDSDTAIFVGWNNGTINGTVKTYAPVMATPVYHPTDPSAPGIALSGSEGVVNVALRAPGSNGRIFYTIDGSKPDPASEDTLQYEGCFQVEHSATIRAIAISEGKSSSVTLLKVAVGDQVKSDSSVFIGEAVFFNADGDVINAVGQLENEKMIQVSLCACQERQEEIGDEATILLAVYDLNGRMMDMQSRTSEVRDSKLLLIESVALPEGSIGSVRLFIVDRMMRPLTTVQQIN